MRNPPRQGSCIVRGMSAGCRGQRHGLTAILVEVRSPRGDSRFGATCASCTPRVNRSGALRGPHPAAQLPRMCSGLCTAIRGRLLEPLWATRPEDKAARTPSKPVASRNRQLPESRRGYTERQEDSLDAMSEGTNNAQEQPLPNKDTAPSGPSGGKRVLRLAAQWWARETSSNTTATVLGYRYLVLVYGTATPLPVPVHSRAIPRCTRILQGADALTSRRRWTFPRGVIINQSGTYRVLSVCTSGYLVRLIIK